MYSAVGAGRTDGQLGKDSVVIGEPDRLANTKSGRSTHETSFIAELMHTGAASLCLVYLVVISPKC